MVAQFRLSGCRQFGLSGRPGCYRDRLMSDPADLNERLRLSRWLAAVGLTVAAEDAARIDTPETNAISLLGAHAACEALLGLLSRVRQYKRSDEVSFPKLVIMASSVVTMPADLADNLDVMHRMRDDFVHASMAVDGLEAARAILNARRLMEFVPASFGRSWNLPDGSGLGTAVAEIVGVEAVGMWLRHADQMQRRGRLQMAADGLARALDGALDRTRPGLRNEAAADRSRPEMQRARVQPGVGSVQSQLDGLYQWVLPLALGTSPIAYRRLRDLIGHAANEDLGGAPVRVMRPAAGTLGDDKIRWAISQTAEIIFRLWAMGSLHPLATDERIEERAREFLANPSGRAAGGFPTGPGSTTNS